MPSESGNVYGMTILSPIVDDPHAKISHDLQLRMYLGTMARNENDPFANVTSTHLTRLTVMNDVVYLGMSASEEHLSKTLQVIPYRALRERLFLHFLRRREIAFAIPRPGG